jgi:hypothetical protein
VRTITHRSKRTSGFSKTYGWFDLNGAAAPEVGSGSRPGGTFASPS